MLETKPTGLRLDKSLHESLKQICEANNTSISQALHVLIELFIHDNDLQIRVLREVTTTK